jgi:hypothetical protein
MPTRACMNESGSRTRQAHDPKPCARAYSPSAPGIQGRSRSRTNCDPALVPELLRPFVAPCKGITVRRLA